MSHQVVDHILKHILELIMIVEKRKPVVNNSFNDLNKNDVFYFSDTLEVTEDWRTIKSNVHLSSSDDGSNYDLNFKLNSFLN